MITDEHESYIRGLQKAHNHLIKNGLNCSFTTFKQAYFSAYDKVYGQTTVTLEEPHFSVYIEETINLLDKNLKNKTFLALEAVNEFSKEFKKYLALDPQAFETLKLAHETHKVGLISNLAFSECAWELLDNYDLMQFLDVIVVSGDVNLRKPHSQIFGMTLRYLNVKPQKAIFVGDTLETDIVGANSAGMTSVHIKRRPTAISDVVPNREIYELKQVLGMLAFERRTIEANFREGNEYHVQCAV